MDIDWLELSKAAWHCRENAYLIGATKVGVALLSGSGKVFVGCNVEHQFRSHDIHAETNAIASMVAAGEQRMIAILIVAKRERFTPCGACMDWIFQFGGKTTLVGYQNAKDKPPVIYTADQLMPHYPI